MDVINFRAMGKAHSAGPHHAAESRFVERPPVRGDARSYGRRCHVLLSIDLPEAEDDR